MEFGWDERSSAYCPILFLFLFFRTRWNWPRNINVLLTQDEELRGTFKIYFKYGACSKSSRTDISSFFFFWETLQLIQAVLSPHLRKIIKEWLELYFYSETVLLEICDYLQTKPYENVNHALILQQDIFVPMRINIIIIMRIVLVWSSTECFRFQYKRAIKQTPL